MVPGQYKPHNLCPSDITWRDGKLKETNRREGSTVAKTEAIKSISQQLSLRSNKAYALFGPRELLQLPDPGRSIVRWSDLGPAAAPIFFKDRRPIKK